MGLYAKITHGIRYWFLKVLPACQQIIVKLSNSMERPLSVRERIQVKLHLWVCAWCQWYLEHLRVMRDTARAHADEAPPVVRGATLSDEARERIRQKLSASN